MTNLLTVAQLAQFDEIIDVRTPEEFALDHIPGARNFPVLNSDERVLVGTLYKQSSEFEAKKLGAALISRNIAHHLQQEFTHRPKTWQPLVYCWRGGMRSGAMQHILRQVGWRAEKLPGGYKAFRRAVRAELDELPQRYRYKVLCGLTGSGKSRLLTALAQQGAQVLDLENIAQHRGSLLGRVPDTPQPAQKMFDSTLWWQLSHFDPARPVFVEAESKKIGNLRLPDALCHAMWQVKQCIRVHTDDTLRIALLRQDYAHFVEHPEILLAALEFLVPIYGHAQIQAWYADVHAGEWDKVVLSLLHQHYDQRYEQSMRLHYVDYVDSPSVNLLGIDEAALHVTATRLLQMV